MGHGGVRGRWWMLEGSVVAQVQQWAPSAGRGALDGGGNSLHASPCPHASLFTQFLTSLSRGCIDPKHQGC